MIELNGSVQRFARRTSSGAEAALALSGGPAPLSRHASRRRRRAFVAFLILFTLFWLTIGFGVIDLAGGFFDGGEHGNQVLSAAYGVIAAIVLPLALLAQLRGPVTVAALQQIAVVALAFALAGVLALDPLSFLSVATLTVMLAVLLRLHPVRPQLLARPRGPSFAVGALTAIAAIPWVVYALRMAANERGDVPPLDAGRPQAGGWAGAAVLAIVVVLLALLAAAKTRGWRVPLWSAAVAATVFGLVSVLNPRAPGTGGRLRGSLAIAWSLVLLAIAEWDARRGYRSS